MTNEQAIEYLLSKYGQADEVAEDAIAIAVKALEKQIAEEPEWEGGYSFYDDDDAEAYCPNCDYYFKDDYLYCPECGQKILWP